MFKDKNIFISGGSGFLGQELTTQLLKYEPKKIIIFSRSDQNHYKMENKFGKLVNVRYIVGDICNQVSLETALEGIDYVLNCASLKHVDRSYYNSLEYKRIIVDGAESIIRASLKCGVKKVVALSTDKASNSINLYGFAKALSDSMFISANQYSKTKFSVIRYGNVVSSDGSFIQKFKNSSENVIKITDERMMRWWITIGYAANLTLKLLTHMQGEEILVPKLPSMRVLDFLKAINPNATVEKIPIRNGEKINETMFNIEQARNALEFEKYYILYNTLPELNKRMFAGEVGVPISEPFEYACNVNSPILSIKDVNDMLDGNFEWNKL